MVVVLIYNIIERLEKQIICPQNKESKRLKWLTLFLVGVFRRGNNPPVLPGGLFFAEETRKSLKPSVNVGLRDDVNKYVVKVIVLALASKTFCEFF